MKDSRQNRFAEEVEAAARNNPKIDMKLVQEWQKISKFLEKIPPPPAPEKTKPPRLQPIPLEMFM